MESYIFILCPNYSGSTLLWKLVSSSEAVSSLPKEGQFLPEVVDIMRSDPWNENFEMPWEKIKSVWHEYWDEDKTYLLEKSPPHLIRSEQILEHFKPVFFLIMVRNPYAHVEGLLRRNKYNPKSGAEYSIHCLRQQAENVKNLENAIHFTYEELALDPKAVSEKIQAFLPKLGTLGYDQKYSVHSIDGNTPKRIMNLNQKKINNIHYRDLKVINQVFSQNLDILEYWGYSYYQPSYLKQMFFYLKVRVDKLIFRAKRKTNHIYQKLTQSS